MATTGDVLSDNKFDSTSHEKGCNLPSNEENSHSTMSKASPQNVQGNKLQLHQNGFSNHISDRMAISTLDGRASAKEIVEPRLGDIICGRQGNNSRIYKHTGNQMYRSLIEANMAYYLSCDLKEEKIELARHVIRMIRNTDPPSRFLKYNESSLLWKEIDEKSILMMVLQAFRDKKLIRRKATKRQHT